MKLEIAKFILGTYDSYYEYHMERLQEEIDVDVDEIAQEFAYSQTEDLIYDELEFEFDFVTQESLSDLISQAEEVLIQHLEDIMEIELEEVV